MREIKTQASEIIIQNARAHNLFIDEIRFQSEGIHIITGPSGSGKSTLIFEIIHREAQYRTLRALHSGIKPIEALPSPALADIGPLPPISAMRHDHHHKWSKQTKLGDVCHIIPLLRGLFIRSAHIYAPESNQKLEAYSPAQLAEQLIHRFPEQRIHCLAPMRSTHNYQNLILELKKQGYARLAIGSKIIMLDNAPPREPKEWSLVIDRLKLQPRHIERLELAIKSAYAASEHRFVALINGEALSFYEKPYFEKEDLFFELPQQNSLHPKSASSICSTCSGVGYISSDYCGVCEGSGLNRLSSLLKLNHCSFRDFLTRPIQHLSALLPAPDSSRSASLLHQYLRPLVDLGLGQLSLRHPANWLSSGERTRARLVALFNSAMPNSTLLIDEPSLGLDQQHHSLLRQFLLRQSKEHPMIIIDHHPSLWEIATKRYELGPGAGPNGGRIVDTVEHATIDVSIPQSNAQSIITLPKQRFCLATAQLNLICGPSGCGKTRLLQQIYLSDQTEFDRIHNLNELNQVQNTRSCVATLTGLWASIRQLLTQTTDAKVQGLTSSQFSFNTPGGRCESCKGLGVLRQSIVGLPSFEQICPICNGHRFEAHIRKIRYRNLNISDILALDITKALHFFSAHPDLYPTLSALNEIGLGHLTLGQASTSLSGGETRRIHLAKVLAGAYKKGRSLERQLYLLDEPTAALHPKDSAVFLQCIAGLCEKGATFLCASHEPLLVAHASKCITL